MRIYTSIAVLLILLATGFTSATGADDGGGGRLIFSSFENSSSGKYAYLHDNIQTMLISRLAAVDEVQVIDRVLSDQDLEQLKNTTDFTDLQSGGADYLVTGRIFEVASGLSVQVSLYPLTASGETLNFSMLSESENDILPDVDKLSVDIAQKILGTSAAPGVAGSNAQQSGGDQGFTTVHPEVAFKKGLYTGTVVGSAVGGFETSATGVKKKLSLDGEIIGLAVADLDGSGENQIVTVDANRLGIYKVDGRVISKVAEKSLQPGLRVHALNIADINGDGRQEIYLSATRGIYVASTILTWNSSEGFVTLAQNIPLYLRPMRIPKKGMRLAGQKRGQEKINLIAPGIQLYTLDAEYKPVAGERLALPRSLNLFDFSYADLDGDGYSEIVAIDQFQNLMVYGPSNELLWVSLRKFAGSKTYLGPTTGSATDYQSKSNFSVDEDADRRLIFVPGKILVTDVNSDGRDEVVVSENKMAGLGLFTRNRPYTSGMVIGLVWNGDALLEAWRTGIYRGYLSNYDIAVRGQDNGLIVNGEDFTKSSASLYVANDPVSGTLASWLPGSAKTDLSVYELQFSGIKTEE